MTNDLQLGGLYLLMAAMLVAGALIGRRAPIARGATSILAFVVIFGAGFIVFSFRDDLHYVAQRLEADQGRVVHLRFRVRLDRERGARVSRRWRVGGAVASPRSDRR